VRTFQVLCLFLGALAISGCAPRFDPRAEAKKLLERDAQWASLASEGRDVEKILSYWSDDATVVSSAQPVIKGKTAIRALVSNNLRTPGFHIHWKSDSVNFSSDGTMAYMSSATTMTVPGPDGKLQTIKSNGVEVWRLEPDGEWQCVMDIASEAAPS
jgi:ketosteroid isomerase-like protein